MTFSNLCPTSPSLSGPGYNFILAEKRTRVTSKRRHSSCKICQTERYAHSPLRYGDRFDEQALKVLPPESIDSERGGVSHFALTGAEPVLVEISGFGPTDTHYVDPNDD